MSSNSGQKFIKRNRPPRVQISYQDPDDFEKQVELPFVMGILADLSGNASPVEKPPMEERKFLDISMDNFDNRMERIEPTVTFLVPDKLSEADGQGDGKQKMGVSLSFKKMDDFNPTAIVRQVPELNKLLQAREQLANLQRYMNGKVAAEKQIKELLSDPQLMQALKERREEAQAADGAQGGDAAEGS